MKTCKDCAHHRACAKWHADLHYDLNHSLAEIADNAACEEFVETLIGVAERLPDPSEDKKADLVEVVRYASEGLHEGKEGEW